MLKTTSAGQETREQGEELDSVEDSYPKCTDIDLVKDTEESQVFFIYEFKASKRARI